MPHPISRRALYHLIRLLFSIYTHLIRSASISYGPSALWSLLLSLLSLNWLIILLIRYYSDLSHTHRPTAAMAVRGLGTRGHFPIPLHIWRRHVPDTLIATLTNTTPPIALQRPPSPLTATLLRSLIRDGFLQPLPLHPPSANTLPNLLSFIHPKNSQKASFIADLRWANTFSTPPPFSLPSFPDIAHLIARHPPATLWAVTLDLSNFFWSLALPAEAHFMFRVYHAHFTTLPFGWNLSPVIAQETFLHILHRTFDSIPDTHVWYFVYYDDLLLLTDDKDLCTRLTNLLTQTLLECRLILSPKSNLAPSQKVTWLGKCIDLQHRSISNTEATTRRALALSILTSHIPLHPRIFDHLTGFLQWYYRPHVGATLFLRSWYLSRHSLGRLDHAFPKMRRALFHLLLRGIEPWYATDPLPPPLLLPVICVDAATSVHGCQLGLYHPTYGARVRFIPDTSISQQGAELLAIEHALHFCHHVGISTASIIGDNRASLHLATTFTPSLSNPHICRTLRRMLHFIQWTHIRAHLLWCPSQLQPADPISRWKPSLYLLAHNADILNRWQKLFNTPSATLLIGTTP